MIPDSEAFAYQVERQFLGCVMRSTIADAATILQQVHDEDIVKPTHRLALQGIRVAVQQGMRPEPVLVVTQLRRDGQLPNSAADLTRELLDMTDTVLVAESARYYLAELIDLAARRRISQAAQRLEQAVGSSTLPDLTQLLRREIDAIRAVLDRRIERTVGAA